MGYDATTFPKVVQSWLDRGWLQSGHSLIEFGAQEFYEGTEADICSGLTAFLGRPIDRVPEIRTVYEAIGVKYDLNRRGRHAWLDVFRPEQLLRLPSTGEAFSISLTTKVPSSIS